MKEESLLEEMGENLLEETGENLLEETRETLLEEAQTNSEPYAVYKKGSLTFYFDTQKSNRGGMGFEIVQCGDKYNHFEGYKWHEYFKKIKTVIFDKSFSNCHCIESTYSWFYRLEKLTLIKGLNNLDTSKVTNMSCMFYRCSSLQSLDVSGFDTSNVTNMNSLFSGCSSLQSLDVSGFDTSKVTNMNYMFYWCQSLQSLDLSGFDTSNVTNMSFMFWFCSSLQVLDVSYFDTSKVTDMSGMFEGIDKSKIKKWR